MLPRKELGPKQVSVRGPCLRSPSGYVADSSMMRSARTNEETLFFQMNPGSIDSIKMIASVFGGIVGNTYWQCAFGIVLLALT
ncbi:hypothetical protein TNCV_4719651 [Trichonephila clavipes]|uniref:Uncharacterized protein n=1 Tax=Trichonephila clavipes TaxID=2585209 RepID=A0A8X7BFU1_TRICX|nr:hypothetical protein TNCV_4719651 [Trichonephila clavipes]